TAQKDPLLFIELASRRARRYSADEERYLVVGDGELAPRLRERIAGCELGDRVIMAGFRTDVDAVLDSLDVFVLHSRYEGMPYTILEAMGHALPIVTTRVAGVADPLRDGGLIVEIGDVTGLDAALDHLVNSERQRELGTANRSRLEQHFSLEKMIAALLEIYCG
ncbi:MAG: glycosyltransferase, partial [Chloroflexales bacterium]|nr:glycosyltransferase [Chloroflexales bacterium]